jgi:hypothetical protein
MSKTNSQRLPPQSPLTACIAACLILGAVADVGAAPVAQPYHGAALTQALRAVVPPISQRGRVAAAPSTGTPALTVQAVSGCGDDPNDFTTLRHAVLVANTGDTIDLSGLQCSKITLTAGAITVAVDDLTIQGPGASALTIDGNQADRVFKHTGAGTLTLAGVTVAKGAVSADKAYGGCIYDKGNLTLRSATLTSCVALGQTAAVGGGAVVFGALTVENSVVSNNLANAAVGGGAKVLSALGGGVVSVSQTEDTRVTHSLVTGNGVQSPTGFTEAGGLVGSRVISKYSTFTGNVAVAAGDPDNYSGGGALVAMYSLSMGNSTVDNNQADVAGAMFLANSGFATILQSTISSNHGNLAAGGIVANLDISIANSTIAFNNGGVFGGGGLLVGGAFKVTVTSSIVADNLPTDVDGGPIGGSSSLIKVVGANATVPAGTIAFDPQLGPLAYNGGATRTHALTAGSPALNNGSLPISLASDQRNGSYARTIGNAPDIGAFEFDPDHIFGDRFDE